jgi:hypothetical protein
MSGTAQCPGATRLWMKIMPISRHFSPSTPISTGVEDARRVAPDDNGEREGAALSPSPPRLESVENLGGRRLVYTRGSPGSEHPEIT